MNKKIYSVLIVVTLLISKSFAQDIHFSQFYASPLTLNPGLTGLTEKSYRAMAIYRNQWRSVTVPYATYGGSFDMRLLESKMKSNIFGAGVLFNADKSGDGKLFFMQAMLSAAFHKSIGKKNTIGIGIQAGYVQKTLKYNQLSFPAQFNGSDFDLNLSNNENFETPSISYVDMNAGLMWQGKLHDRLGMMAGFSVFHLTQPKESFLGKDNKLSMRYSGNLGARVKINDKWYITPNFIYQTQAKAQEINFGTAVEYNMEVRQRPLILSLGGWYRLKDAGVVSASAEYLNTRIGFAYDVNASELTPASNNRGAFEIYIMYNGLLSGGDKPVKPIMVPCPRM